MTESDSGSSSIGNGIKQLNWPTVILVLLSGGANLFLTDKGNIQVQGNREEIERSMRQIRDLHAALYDFEKRQTKSLDNQNAMMSADSELLKQVHDIVRRLEEFKRLQQMRGAPE